MESSSKNNEMPAAAVPFPGSLTPGWNDPPLLNNSTSRGNRLNLNKRVAFPLSGDAKVGVPSSFPQSAPPKLPPYSIDKMPIPTNSNFDVNPIELQENAVEKVMLEFKAVAQDNESKQQLERIEELWKSNQITSEIKHILYRTADALGQKNFTEAARMQAQLITQPGEDNVRWSQLLHQIIMDKERAAEICEKDKQKM